MWPTASGVVPPVAQGTSQQTKPGEDSDPIFIRLLGAFGLTKAGRVVPTRRGGKTEGLLAYLASEHGRWVTRETLLDHLWPSADSVLAGQSLHSLVHTLHRQLGDAIGGAPPVVRADGRYRLNLEAGVSVDVTCFERLTMAAEAALRAGDRAGAVTRYVRAAKLYHGDLCLVPDVRALIERERLRVLFLKLLVSLAEHYYQTGEYASALDHCHRLLTFDPCREDAHRLAMRCHMQLGARTQAMRQFRLCEQLLRTEFDATPEPASQLLFDQIRLTPDTV
jgi:DNA-binding SARP family transcriptional activator